MRRSFQLASALAVFLGSACGPGSPGGAAPTADGPSVAPEAPAGAEHEGTIFHLEGWHGAAESLWVQASYKIRREAGQVSKTLSIELEDAPPGASHALSLDGFALGKLSTSSKGKAEYELTEAGDKRFPKGFQEPRDGSLLRIGELAEIRLLTVHKLTDLQVEFAGPGKLAGKIGYKVERLGETVTREFQVKVTQAGERSVQPVRIDGAYVGDLSIDPGGKGKLVYSTLIGEPFPPDFREPRAGSIVELGGLYSGQLRDDLVDRDP